MKRFAKLIFLCLLCLVGASEAAEPVVSANAVADMMQQAKYSDGFEARFNVLITKANGAHPAPFKLAVIGQYSETKQRLLIRGISPEALRDHFYAAERLGDGRIRMLEARAQSGSEYIAVDPTARIFASGLVAWDMFAPWWAWHKQSLDGTERINGHECVKIRSFADDKNSIVKEVESCVDQLMKLSLRTRMFDSTHALLRSTEVVQQTRKNGGEMMAKKLKITDAAKTKTEIEVYAGDEEYQISAETFAMFDGQNNISRQRETQ